MISKILKPKYYKVIIINQSLQTMLRDKDRSEVYKVAVNAALGSFLFGYQLVNISSLQQLFQNANSLSNQETRAMLSIITAALPLSAIIGSALLTTLIKHFKGRYLMIYMDILAIVGIIIQDIKLSLWPLFLGRMILGFVVGINSGLVAQYTFSVTPTTLSGSVGALRQVFLNVGVSMGYALGFLINPSKTDDQLNWRILISFPVITCLIRAILLLTVLPYQIPLHRTKSKTIQRMQKYYYKIYENYALGDPSLPSSAPQQQIAQPTLQQPLTKTKSKQRKNLIICIILAGSNQFCGINAIIFYAKQLFMRVTDNNNNLSQVIIIFLGVVQILATFVGGKMMDRYSKRYFLFGGELCMVFILAAIYLFNQNIPLVVTLIFMHTIAYSFSIGQLLLYYANRMLDTTGSVVMFNWFATFLVAISAQFMMKMLGIGLMCLIFCILLSICLALLWYNLPSDQQLLQRQQQTSNKPSPKKNMTQLVQMQNKSTLQSEFEGTRQSKVLDNQLEISSSRQIVDQDEKIKDSKMCEYDSDNSPNQLQIKDVGIANS